jgi:predicted Zn finger-like uncharacterized protein
MINLGKEKVKIDCPECKRSITITIKQIADEVLVKCSCGQEIQLIDEKGTNKNRIRDVS